MKRISTFLRFVLIAMVLIVPVSMISAQAVSWEQTGNEIPGPGAGSEAGKSVAISSDGSIVAIGAAKYDGARGNVRVYQNQAGIWTQIGADFTSAKAADNLGSAVSLSSDGTILAIGAWGKDETGDDNKGFVQIYQYDGISWNQIGADIYGEEANDQSGSTVSLSSDGSIVAVGSPYYNSEKGTVRVYQNLEGTWTKLGENIGGDASDGGGRSGWWSSLSISSDGSIVAIGANQNDDNGNNAGRTRIFKYESGAWVKIGNDIVGVVAEELGISVRLNSNGSRVAVGVYRFAGSTGCTRIYDYNSSTNMWNMVGANIIGEASQDHAGKSVSLNSDGSIVAIGAPLNNGTGTNDVGQIRVYKYISGNWSKVGEDIDGVNGLDYNGLGVALSANGTVLASGNTGSNANFVKVYTATAAWKGTISTDWLVPENWDVELVPTSNISAKIADDLTNYPTLTAPAYCKNLIIESTGTSTGSILGQSNLTVNGTTTIKRHMTGNAWHFVASPAPGEDIQSFLTTNTNVPTKSGSRGMMDYNEATNNWNSFFTAATSGTLEAGKGYSLRTDADGTIQFVGTLETGNVSPAVAATSAVLGWNSVGNPYPSAIFINSAADATNNFINLNDANFDPSYKAIYVWEQGNNVYSIVGKYDEAYTAALGQAFMVKAKTGTANFQFTTDLQTHAPATVLKSGGVEIPEIKLVAQLANQKSSTLIKFEDGMNAGLDPGYDIGILKSGFDFYSTLVDDNGVDFGMQFLPSILLDKSEIALGLESKESGSVTISALSENLPLGYKVILEDRLLGTFAELNETENYTTDITNYAQGKGRFYLHIENSTTKIGDITETSDLNAFYANEKIVINGNIQGNGQATIFDMMGRKIKEVQLERIQMNTISTLGLKNGIYILNIQHEGGLFTKKIPLNR